MVTRIVNLGESTCACEPHNLLAFAAIARVVLRFALYADVTRLRCIWSVMAQMGGLKARWDYRGPLRVLHAGERMQIKLDLLARERDE